MIVCFSTSLILSSSWDCKGYGHRAGDKECMYRIKSIDRSEEKSSKKARVSFCMSEAKEAHEINKSVHKTSNLQERREGVNSKGLEQTIVEMLRNYEPTSAERKPFWCRICRFQGTCIKEYEDHMKSELHKKAKRIERSLSTCKLCRKEFTSPDQLREHEKGKAHKERLKSLSSLGKRV